MASSRVRKAVTQVTDIVFPSSSKVSLDKKLNPHQIIRGNEYVSSLPLAMAYYFNMFYYPFWALSAIYCLQLKYDYLDMLYKIIVSAIIVVLVVIDFVRLYVGYLGNITEQVPELAGSWLLTILISLPLNLFLLLNESTIILPFERATNSINIIFVILEIIAGYFAIRSMVNYQVTRFHQKQFYDVRDLNEAGLPVVDDQAPIIGAGSAYSRRKVNYRA